jgi:hypothetical protein
MNDPVACLGKYNYAPLVDDPEKKLQMRRGCVRRVQVAFN